MGYVKCRSCDGIGKKFFDRYDKSGRYYEKVVDCKACSGTGINQKFYSKNCEKCYAEIIYPRAANYPPKYCRDCKERIQAERERQAVKWKTKSCKKCHQTIKYNVEWNKIPELCKDCIAKEKAKWKEKNNNAKHQHHNYQ
jgi:RecJ-like exonuclease